MLNLRPSRVVRGIEDTVLFIGTAAATGVLRATRAVRSEYQARQLAASARSVEEQARKIEAMSPAEQAAFYAAQAAVHARAGELLAKRTRERAPRDEQPAT